MEKLDLQGMVRRVINNSQLYQEFTYEPSEIIEALFENTTGKSKRSKKKNNSFKERQTQEPQKLRLFSNNSYYIKHTKDK